MKSVKSYFSPTIFAKTLKRYWPVWVCYAILWGMLLPLQMSSLRNPLYTSALETTTSFVLDSAVTSGVIMGFIFGGISVMLIWLNINSSRLANGMACLPVRREAMFISTAAAGLAALLGVNVLIAALTALIQACFGALNLVFLLYWLGIVSLQLLFFFGFATFCAMLTGNSLIMPLIYGVLNFCVPAVDTICGVILSNIVFGHNQSITTNSLSVWLSPPVGMIASARESLNYVYSDTHEFVSVAFHGWGTLLVYGAVGLAFLLIALLLFSKRRMESAGDAVAVRVLKPVFKYCLAFGGAIAFTGLFYLFSEGISSQFNPSASLEVFILLAIGCFIGYFGASILLKKSFRAFKGGFKGFFISVAVLLVLVVTFSTDVFGMETRVIADADEVNVYFMGYGISAAEQENIDEILKLHELIIDSKDEIISANDDNSCMIEITYCKNGKATLSRMYYLPGNTESTAIDELFDKGLSVFNSREAIEQRLATSVDVNVNTVIDAGIVQDSGESGELPEDYDTTVYTALSAADFVELYNTCILPDIEDGTLGKLAILTEGDDYSYLGYAYDELLEIQFNLREIVPEAIAEEEYEYYAYSNSYNISPEAARTYAWVMNYLAMGTEF